jgi:hypothetical protein
MESLMTDPVTQALHGPICGPHGIRASIRSAIEQGHIGAAIILIFAAIDAMANLDRPSSEPFSRPDDFLRWAERYFRVDGETQITPKEWLAARNAIVHTYGVYSRRHDTAGVRVLLWAVGAIPPVRYNPAVQPDYVVVDVLAMRDALFAGMDRFLIEAFADTSRRALMEQRLQELIMEVPYRNGAGASSGPP